MKTNRSGKPEADAPVASTPPAAQSAPKAPEVKRPQIGDVVLFNYKAPSARAAITVPMVITKVHSDGQIVDGVAFNSNNTGGSMGAISMHGAHPGEGEMEWRAR